MHNECLPNLSLRWYNTCRNKILISEGSIPRSSFKDDANKQDYTVKLHSLQSYRHVVPKRLYMPMPVLLPYQARTDMIIEQKTQIVNAIHVDIIENSSPFYYSYGVDRTEISVGNQGYGNEEERVGGPRAGGGGRRVFF